jgi:hypothetical protein
MAIITTVYQSKSSNDTSFEDHAKSFLKTDQYKIVETIETVYGITTYVECYVGKVVSINPCNLAFHDDYRPGAEVKVFNNGEIKRLHISYEDARQSAKVDADEATMIAYKNLIAYNIRKNEIKNKLKERKNFMEDANIVGITYHKMKKLHNAIGDEKYNEAVKLLKSFMNERIRSDFRKSLASRIFHWLIDPAPQYKSPLSSKQLQYLIPFKRY